MKKNKNLKWVLFGVLFYALNWIIGLLFHVKTPVTWLIEILTPFKNCGASCSELFFGAFILVSIGVFILTTIVFILIGKNIKKIKKLFK